MRSQVFSDREEAGRFLGDELGHRGWTDPIVLGLARGGVPVADVVARRLGAPLEVAVARKIGAPGRPEFGVGAVAASGAAIYDQAGLDHLGVSQADLAETEAAERAEACRRISEYRGDRETAPLRGRDVILVDDGLATGVTATVVLRALRREAPRRLVFAVPVCAPRAANALRYEADEVVCVEAPTRFRAVGQWYADFRQVKDTEVIGLLTRSHRVHPRVLT